MGVASPKEIEGEGTSRSRAGATPRACEIVPIESADRGITLMVKPINRTGGDIVLSGKRIAL